MKIQSFHVAQHPNENLTVQVINSIDFYQHLHQHKELQLSIVVKGKGKLLIGDSVHYFKDNDIFVIGANSPHLFKNDRDKKNVQMISLFFTKDTLGHGFFDLPDLEEIRPFFLIAQNGFQLLSDKNSIKKLMLQLPDSSKLSRLVLFLQLLSIICKAKRKSLTTFVYPKETKLIVGERLQVVFDYALHNFQGEVKLDTIAKLAFMTPNAFCKFFKQRTNKTFFQFLIELRIEHASQLLLSEKYYSIAQIAELSGFKSISNFNKKFKTHKGIVASKYRQSLFQRV